MDAQQQSQSTLKPHGFRLPMRKPAQEKPSRITEEITAEDTITGDITVTECTTEEKTIEEDTTEEDTTEEDTTEEDTAEEDFDLSGFEPSNLTVSARVGTQPGGGISVINSAAKGKCKRVELSLAVMSHLDLADSTSDDDKIQIMYGSNQIVIGQNLPDTCVKYSIRRGKKGEKRGFIYHSGLVLDLTARYGIDFSNGHSCRSFSDIRLTTSGTNKIVVIKMS